MKDKISCICIADRSITAVEKTIVFFEEQTYADKELIIVYTKEDLEIKNFAESASLCRRITLSSDHSISNSEWHFDVVNDVSSPVVFLEIQTDLELSIYAKRKQAVVLADGEYMCYWNVYDYYAPLRLQRQLDFLKEMNKPAVTLANVYIYHKYPTTSYLSVLEARGWDETLLCKKEEWQMLEEGRNASEIFSDERKLAVMEDPELYIYYIYGRYTSDEQYSIFYCSIELDKERTQEIRNTLLFPINRNVKVYDGVLTLGCWCQVGGIMVHFMNKKINSPLDHYGIKDWLNLIKILETGFSDYWDRENLAIGATVEEYSLKYCSERTIYKVYDNKYTLVSNHHFDAGENSSTELNTYDEFKSEMVGLSKIFLRQCETYESILFTCKIMSLPYEETTIERGDIKRLCDALSGLRNGRPYELKLSLPERWYDQVLQWIKEDKLTHVTIFPWVVAWNGDKYDEEWQWMYGNAQLASNYLERLEDDIIGLIDSSLKSLLLTHEI